MTSNFASGESRWWATPPNGYECTVEADQQSRRDFSIEAHPRENGSTGGVTDNDVRIHIERAKKLAEIRRHAGQRQPMRRRRLGETVAGQIRRDDTELLREDRRQGAP
jgi:hypothetical protein